MRSNKIYFIPGILFLLLGIVGIFFSQMIIEDILKIEREFGQEPLSLTFVRAGLISSLLGVGLLLFSAWRNQQQKN